jgi:hypothetical protein
MVSLWFLYPGIEKPRTNHPEGTIKLARKDQRIQESARRRPGGPALPTREFMPKGDDDQLGFDENFCSSPFLDLG